MSHSGNYGVAYRPDAPLRGYRVIDLWPPKHTPQVIEAIYPTPENARRLYGRRSLKWGKALKECARH